MPTNGEMIDFIRAHGQENVKKILFEILDKYGEKEAELSIKTAYELTKLRCETTAKLN